VSGKTKLAYAAEPGKHLFMVVGENADFLDAQLDPGEPLETDEERAAFRIRSDRMASWALRKLARARQEEERIILVAQERIGDIERWRDEALQGPRRDAAFFEAAVADYHRQMLDKIVADLREQMPDASFEDVWAKVKTKSYKLPEGTIKARRPGTTLEVSNPDTLVAWALANERTDLLADPKPANITTLKEKLAIRRGGVVDPDTGEAIPGITPKIAELDSIQFGVEVTKAEQPAYLPPPADDA
jgi:hypothetical protein